MVLSSAFSSLIWCDLDWWDIIIIGSSALGCVTEKAKICPEYLEDVTSKAEDVYTFYIFSLRIELMFAFKN